MMGIIQLLQSGYYCWLNSITKIMPKRVAYAFLKIWIIVLILGIVIFRLVYFPSNREFYKIQVIGQIEKIEKIENKSKHWAVKIDTNWYFVQKLGMNKFKKGQRIVKESDSWLFTVYDSIGNIVYQDNAKYIIFHSYHE